MGLEGERRECSLAKGMCADKGEEKEMERVACRGPKLEKWLSGWEGVHSFLLHSPLAVGGATP